MLTKQAGPLFIAIAASVLETLLHPVVGVLLFVATTLFSARRFSERRILTIALAAVTLFAIFVTPVPFSG